VPFWAKDVKVGFGNISAKAERKPAFREKIPAATLPRTGRYLCGWKKTATSKHYNDAQQAVFIAAQPDAGLDTAFRGAINAIAEWK
jgi:hypothetical protein